MKLAIPAALYKPKNEKPGRSGLFVVTETVEAE
jgi:hypothetical protein